MSSFFFCLAKIFCWEEAYTMAVVYATLIVKGKKTIDQVPELLKPKYRKSLMLWRFNKRNKTPARKSIPGWDLVRLIMLLRTKFAKN